MGEHLVPVIQLDPEHGVGQGLYDGPLDLDDVVLGHAPAFRFQDPPVAGAQNTAPNEAGSQYRCGHARLSTGAGHATIDCGAVTLGQ